jgi:hypothetical protein
MSLRVLYRGRDIINEVLFDETKVTYKFKYIAII